ncbi:hypothetical protein Tco_1525040 [Tanacetum coccineum]
MQEAKRRRQNAGDKTQETKRWRQNAGGKTQEIKRRRQNEGDKMQETKRKNQIAVFNNQNAGAKRMNQNATPNKTKRSTVVLYKPTNRSVLSLTKRRRQNATKNMPERQNAVEKPKQIPSVGVFDEVYFSFGRHFDELHVTWAHLEKKQTRLQTNTKTLEDLCSQRMETASSAIHDAVTTHQSPFVKETLVPRVELVTSAGEASEKR